MIKWKFPESKLTTIVSKLPKSKLILIAIASLAVLTGASYTAYAAFWHKDQAPASQTPSATSTEPSTNETQPTADQPEPVVTEQPESVVDNEHHDSQTVRDGIKYLKISEWGVQLPLSDSTEDAYYVRSFNGSSVPNIIFLGVESMDGTGTCEASKSNQGKTPLASIIRAQKDERDGVTGELLREEYPIGVLIGDYYYGFIDWTTSRPCTTEAPYDAQLKIVNQAFSNATPEIMIAE